MTISAKVIADSISPQGIRLTTLQLRYPKFIHGEFMTHRVFSRNASSSRAIPVERLIKNIIDDPVNPSFWGKNQPGMQAHEEHNAYVPVYGWGGGTERTREGAWDLARFNAIKAARSFAEAGYHKQIINRILEPFCHINVVVTATEWKNFFELRCHPDAQPEMRVLAEEIRDARALSTPVELNPGQWHLPYCPDVHGSSLDGDAIRVSVARCARVSYLTQEGKTPTIAEDIKLYERLIGARPIHASPAEHQATPDNFVGTRITLEHRHEHKWTTPHLHGNLSGWIQYRKMIEGQFK